MSQFTVTRKRILQQKASVVVTVKDGEKPADVAAKLADSKWKWANTSETELSSEVAPFAEEIVTDA